MLDAFLCAKPRGRSDFQNIVCLGCSNSRASSTQIDLVQGAGSGDTLPGTPKGMVCKSPRSPENVQEACVHQNPEAEQLRRGTEWLPLSEAQRL